MATVYVDTTEFDPRYRATEACTKSLSPGAVLSDLEATLMMILPATLSTTSGCHRRECEGTRNVPLKQIVANVLAPKVNGF